MIGLWVRKQLALLGLRTYVVLIDFDGVKNLRAVYRDVEEVEYLASRVAYQINTVTLLPNGRIKGEDGKYCVAWREWKYNKKHLTFKEEIKETI